MKLCLLHETAVLTVLVAAFVVLPASAQGDVRHIPTTLELVEVHVSDGFILANGTYVGPRYPDNKDPDHLVPYRWSFEPKDGEPANVLLDFARVNDHRGTFQLRVACADVPLDGILSAYFWTSPEEKHSTSRLHGVRIEGCSGASDVYWDGEPIEPSPGIPGLPVGAALVALAFVVGIRARRRPRGSALRHTDNHNPLSPGPDGPSLRGTPLDAPDEGDGKGRARDQLAAIAAVLVILVAGLVAVPVSAQDDVRYVPATLEAISVHVVEDVMIAEGTYVGARHPDREQPDHFVPETWYFLLKEGYNADVSISFAQITNYSGTFELRVNCADVPLEGVLTAYFRDSPYRSDTQIRAYDVRIEGCTGPTDFYWNGEPVEPSPGIPGLPVGAALVALAFVVGIRARRRPRGSALRHT